MDAQPLEMGTSYRQKTTIKTQDMHCSVIILNWNGAAILRRYLPSVIQYTLDCPNTEIVVADNGSTDESLRILNEEFPSVRVIAFDKNYGFAEGYNKAIAQVDSEYVVLLNSDVEVTHNWLTPLVNYLEKHSDVVAVQPKIHSWLNKEKFEHAGAAGGYLDALCYPFCRGRLLNCVATDNGQYDDIADVLWTSGACMCIRRDVYKAVGALDAEFFAHMEEIDLCWRLNCRGYRLCYLPDSMVYHLGGGALNYESPHKTYLNFRNNLLMIYKNMPANRLWGVLAMRFVLDYAAALQLLVTGKPLNAWAVVRARWDYRNMRKCYKDKRTENMKHMKIAIPSGIKRRCILWDFYIKRRCE